jgi:hypothetical protein
MRVSHMRGAMEMADHKMEVKGLLLDLRAGMSISELMAKYALTEDKLNRVCRELNRPDLAALRKLWEMNKLTESQFTRAFAEVEDVLNRER